jgi:[acyl-carrier-protein] S-malonyltransferase
MSLAFVFPGQGSQSVGMLSALGAAEAVVHETFAEASAVLGYDLWALCQQGPDVSSAQQNAPSPRCWQRASRPGAYGSITAVRSRWPWLASLGEYSALVCSGAPDFSDAIDPSAIAAS